MKANFNLTFSFLHKWEGYKSDDPNDPGRRTIYGISETYHPETVKRLWDMEKSQALIEAKKFYKAKYWDKIGADDLANGFDIMLFDIAVNPGMKLVNRLKPLLPKYSISEFKRIAFVNTILIERIRYYNLRVKARRANIKYLHGWLNRSFDLWRFVSDHFNNPPVGGVN